MQIGGGCHKTLPPQRDPNHRWTWPQFPPFRLYPTTFIILLRPAKISLSFTPFEYILFKSIVRNLAKTAFEYRPWLRRNLGFSRPLSKSALSYALKLFIFFSKVHNKEILQKIDRKKLIKILPYSRSKRLRPPCKTHPSDSNPASEKTNSKFKFRSGSTVSERARHYEAVVLLEFFANK